MLSRDVFVQVFAPREYDVELLETDNLLYQVVGMQLLVESTSTSPTPRGRAGQVPGVPVPDQAAQRGRLACSRRFSFAEKSDRWLAERAPATEPSDRF